MIHRILKIILISAVASYTTIVSFNNMTDYHSNFMFVQHVLSMDTTFPNNNGMWRSITVSWVHHAVYITIITAETLTAAICWYGALGMWRSRNNTPSFCLSRDIACVGLALGIVLWFVGFIVIGGEWFLMWQSSVWNAIDTAAQTSLIILAVLIYTVLPEPKVEEVV